MKEVIMELNPQTLEPEEGGVHYKVTTMENGTVVKQIVSEKIDDEQVLKPVERIAELEAENALLKAQNKALSDRTDFHEDVLTEIILTMHS